MALAFCETLRRRLEFAVQTVGWMGIGRRERPFVHVVGCRGLRCRKVNTGDMSEPATDMAVEEDIAVVVLGDGSNAGRERRADDSEVDKVVMYRDGMAHRHFDKVIGCRIGDIDRTCARESGEGEAVQNVESRWEHEVDVEMALHLVCIDYPAYRPEDLMVQRQKNLTATCLAEVEGLLANQKSVLDAVEASGGDAC